MTDSTMVFPPGFVLLKDGLPVSGGKAKFFEAGTTTPKTVYSDRDLGGGNSLGSTVYTRSDGMWAASSVSSTLVPVFIGSGLYKLVITDANDVTIWSGDNLKGALDTSTFLTSSSTSTLSIPVVATSGPTLTLGTSHRGKHIRANTSGGSITLTLDAAATLGDGWNVEIGKHSASNGLIITTTGGETINFAGGSRSVFALTKLGERISIRCDGTAFYVGTYVPPLFDVVGIITIADRVTSAPVGPSAGARYIVTSGFSSFSTHDIIEYDGVSGYVKYTPATDCGWLSYVQDENAYYSFQDSAWTQVFAPASDTVAGLIELAVQSEMETATDVVRAVVPGRQHFHPGHPKAGGNFNGTGTPAFRSGDYGMGAITDNGTGTWTLALDTAFNDTNYWVTGMSRHNADTAVGDARVGMFASSTKSASSFGVTNWDAESDGMVDSSEIGISFSGDYA